MVEPLRCSNAAVCLQCLHHFALTSCLGVLDFLRPPTPRSHRISRLHQKLPALRYRHQSTVDEHCFCPNSTGAVMPLRPSASLKSPLTCFAHRPLTARCVSHRPAAARWVNITATSSSADPSQHQQVGSTPPISPAPSPGTCQASIDSGSSLREIRCPI